MEGCRGTLVLGVQGKACSTMGSATRLKFPLPHRRQKQQQHQEVQSISSPMTNKAQKFLGNAEINIDATSPTSPHETSRTWETHSAASGISGISVTISETTVSATTSRTGGTTVPTGAMTRGKASWDQESDIIPRGLGISGSTAGRSQPLDLTTDASSLRRRGSGSTIVSYYDKSKLPLSISQQTSSSAMAKGLPAKAAELLDMECPRPAPSPPKKKPGRLDLSHLLPSSASSRLARFAQKGSMVLGPDLLTRSPSLMSTSSPGISPSRSDSRSEKKLRKKLTKESLRSLSSPRPERLGSWSAETKNSELPTTSSLRKRATDTGNLHNLYQHYEQTSFRDTIDHGRPAPAPSRRPSQKSVESPIAGDPRRESRQGAAASSPSTNKPRHHVSPSFNSVTWRAFPAYSPNEDCGPIAENPRTSVTSSNLASPAGEYATSVSSRHTRTSRASKMTESFADFDPNATSVLSLSSDSEDDYPDPPRTGTSNPSVGSRDSVFSPVEPRRPSNTSTSQDSVRSQPRSKFRTSLSPQAPFLSIPEHAKGPTPAAPPINPRTSSLGSALTNSSPRPSVSTTTSSVRSPSRLSQVSASTTESNPPHFSRPRAPVTNTSPKQLAEVRHVAMLQSRTTTPVQRRPDPISERVLDTPGSRSPDTAKRSQPTPPLSPSSMEFVIRDQHDATTAQDSPILTLSGTDSAENERFIAVTRQEEMLLAAMRAKRALMRENSQIPSAENASSSDTRDKTAAKKESLSSIKTVKASSLVPPPLKTRPSHRRGGSRGTSTTMRFPEPPSSKKEAGQPDEGTGMDSCEREHEQVLMYLDRTMSTMSPYDMAEPSPDLGDFIIDFDAGQFPAPPKTSRDKASHSRNSSTASAAGRLTHPKHAQHRRQSSFGMPRPDSEFMPSLLPSSPEPTPPMPSYHSSRLDGWDDSKATERAGKRVETSPAFDEDSDSVQQPLQPASRKKAVRISAVGLAPPEIGQWGDDG